jgi:phosphoribosylpyrophosphate synthetase
LVSSSCSTSDRGCVTFVMVISSCNTSGRGRVTLVMVSSSYSTSERGRVTLVTVVVPTLLVVEPELLTITRITRPL